MIIASTLEIQKNEKRIAVTPEIAKKYISSGFQVLDNASLETLKKWKFTPAKIGNKFVDDTVKIPVKFLITN